jgi:hypothetical protein
MIFNIVAFLNSGSQFAAASRDTSEAAASSSRKVKQNDLPK